MTVLGWLLSLLAGMGCAALVWWACKALAPRRLRYVQPYRPEAAREDD